MALRIKLKRISLSVASVEVTQASPAVSDVSMSTCNCFAKCPRICNSRSITRSGSTVCRKWSDGLANSSNLWVVCMSRSISARITAMSFLACESSLDSSKINDAIVRIDDSGLRSSCAKDPASNPKTDSLSCCIAFRSARRRCSSNSRLLSVTANCSKRTDNAANCSSANRSQRVRGPNRTMPSTNPNRSRKAHIASRRSMDSRINGSSFHPRTITDVAPLLSNCRKQLMSRSRTESCGEASKSIRTN